MYNIRNVINRGLKYTLGEMEQANVELGVFQETNGTDGIYTQASAGYRVIALETPIRNSGGGFIFYWEAPHF